MLVIFRYIEVVKPNKNYCKSEKKHEKTRNEPPTLIHTFDC